MTSKHSKPVQSPDVGASGKRAYVKPVVRHETVFEVMALACGKVSGTSGPCAANRKTS